MMGIATSENLYWTHLKHEHWSIYVAATTVGICYVGSQNAEFNELEKWVKKRLPNYIMKEEADVLKPYLTELVSYLELHRKGFTQAIDLHGTPFQQIVWRALQEIEYGLTVSYTDIADRMQRPSSVRAIASAIGANPILIIVPCHRVIAKSGKLTGYRGGLDMKKELLELEK